MRRGSRFLIGLAAAGLSFGTLYATLGQGEFNKYGWRKHGCYEQQHGCCNGHEHHKACKETSP